MASTTTEFLLYLFTLLFIYGSCKYESDMVDGRECARTCKLGGTPMTCYFRFEVELYYTMSKACYNCPYNITDCFRPDCIPADGVGRLITVINRKLPGPSIEVCLGDTLVVDVVNSMVEESTSIHWHGHHQKYTPYMDGVPFITQCPIASGTTFRYLVKAIHAGTHFWHSHTGTQRADGAFGSMIIRKPTVKETHADLYDYDLQEHVIQLVDWIHESSVARFEAHYQSTGTNKPDTILVNGMGQFQEFPLGDKTLYTPVPKFNVEKGKRYRFRVINAGVLYCPIQISVEDHTMLIISSDGSDIQPVYAETFTIYAGERWDFILDANNNASNYWMKFRGLKDCGEKYNKVYSLGILHYRGAPNSLPSTEVSYELTDRKGMHINEVNKPAGELDSLTAAEISAGREIVHDPALKENPDISLTLAFDFYPVDNAIFQKKNLYGFNDVAPNVRRYTPQINHISMKMPSFPPLSEPERITPNTFCNESQLHNCDKEFCHCVYKIDLPLYAVVELLLVDEGLIYDSNHPFHLHGHSFRVLTIDKLGNFTTVDEVKKLDEEGKVKRNLYNPPLKDTVTVPDGGYTIVRFYTHNPGYWLLHCHLDFHVEVGMAVVLKVGEEKDFPPVPKNFPRCGDFYDHATNEVNTETEETVTIASDDSNTPDVYVYNTTTSTKNESTSVIDNIWNSFSHSNSATSYSKVTTSLPICAFILYLCKYLFL